MGPLGASITVDRENPEGASITALASPVVLAGAVEGGTVLDDGGTVLDDGGTVLDAEIFGAVGVAWWAANFDDPPPQAATKVMLAMPATGSRRLGSFIRDMSPCGKDRSES
jgi:hypothetical protein